jgi:hypothetical protein
MGPTGRSSSPDDRGEGFEGIRRDPRGEAYARLLRHLRAELAAAMAEIGISRAELARRLGVSPSVITRVMDPAADVLISTLFDLAWAMDREWQARVIARQDMAAVGNGGKLSVHAAFATGGPSSASNVTAIKDAA